MLPFSPLSEATAAEEETTEPEPVELTSTGIAYAAELADLEAQRQELDDRIADAKAAIQTEMGDREVATISGRPAFTWKRSTRRTFDQAAAKKLLGPSGTEACQRVTEVRTFRRTGE